MASPRSSLRRLLELIALTALAITQPVLDAFGSGAEEFIFRDVSALGIIGFALLIAIGPAFALWIVQQLGERVAGRIVGDLIHVILIIALVAVFVAQVAKATTGWRSAILIAVALSAGVAIASAWWIDEITSLVMAVVALFAPVSVALFLFASPAADILFDDGTASAARVQMQSPASVVLIVLDELPTLSLLDANGNVDDDRWPGFASLAEDSTWFRNASAVAPSTPTAVPALLSGNYPVDIEALPVVDEHPQNLFTMLAGTHEMRVHESITKICPEELCGKSDGGPTASAMFGLLTDAADIVIERTRPQRTIRTPLDFKVGQSDPSADRKIGEWLDRVVPSSGLHLDAIHAVLPHQPWWRLETGQRYGGSGEGAQVVAHGLDAAADYSWNDAFVSESARQRHLLQLKFADIQLMNILERLRENGIYDESLVIVTADHGAGFSVQQPLRRLGNGNESEVMWVPLFVKQPQQSLGTIDDRPAETIDIVPTIADVLSFELPWEVDGKSLFGPIDAGEDVRRFAKWKPDDAPEVDGVLIPIDGSAAFERLLKLPPPSPIDPEDAWAFYRFGRYGHLLGVDVAEYSITDAAEGWSLAEADRYRAVDTSASTLPAYVHGTAELPSGTPVAIAMNGTVVGWAQIVPTGDGPSWWTVSPAASFLLGSNEVELFVIAEQDARTIELQRLQLTAG